jgi:hypothetical protein
MVEYVKTINICYIIAMTFQFYSKFIQKEHVYLTEQYKEMDLVDRNSTRTERRVTFIFIIEIYS